MRGWIRADERARGEAPGGTSAMGAARAAADEREELLMLREQNRQLEKENGELRRANEILKVASAFFARELDLIRR
jgi:transposase